MFSLKSKILSGTAVACLAIGVVALPAGAAGVGAQMPATNAEAVWVNPMIGTWTDNLVPRNEFVAVQDGADRNAFVATSTKPEPGCIEFKARFLYVRHYISTARPNCDFTGSPSATALVEIEGDVMTFRPLPIGNRPPAPPFSYTRVR